jgi:RNA polymerase sigma-70 factor (ECF subfamily)
MTSNDAIGSFSAAALKKGDEKAFEVLFRHFFRPLCYFVERIVVNQPAAEDIVEESFIKLWNKRGQFQSIVHIKHFLYRVSYNASLDYLKTHQREVIREEIFAQLHVAISDNFHHEMLRAEVLGALYHAIAGLPPQCSRVMSMSYLDGLKNAEIAEKLGVSMQTVKNQKSKGLRILQSQFSKYPSCILFFLTCHLWG